MGQFRLQTDRAGVAIDTSDGHVAMAVANDALPDGHPRKFTKWHADSIRALLPWAGMLSEHVERDAAQAADIIAALLPPDV